MQRAHAGSWLLRPHAPNACELAAACSGGADEKKNDTQPDTQHPASGTEIIQPSAGGTAQRLPDEVYICNKVSTTCIAAQLHAV